MAWADKLKAQADEIEKAVNRVTKFPYHDLLVKRYLEGKQWNQIEIEMYQYSRASMFRYAKDAKAMLAKEIGGD